MIKIDTSSNKKNDFDFANYFNDLVNKKKEESRNAININDILNILNKKKEESYIDKISKKLKKNMPWLHNKVTTKQYIDLGDLNQADYLLMFVDSNALSNEWNKAASRLEEILYYTENPSYDFKIGNNYIKKFGTHIQVNDMIIPTFARSNFFDDLNNDQKVTLYNISININAISLAA